MTPELRSKIEAVMKAGNHIQLLEETLTNSASILLKDCPPAFTERFLAWYRKDLMSLYLEKLFGVWEKFWTVEELDQLLAFYKTPLGQKTIKLQPYVVAESLQIYQDLAPTINDKARQLMEELEEEERNARLSSSGKVFPPIRLAEYL